LVDVPEVRHFQELRLGLERVTSVAAEKARLGNPELRVAAWIQNVAAVAVVKRVGWEFLSVRRFAEEEVAPGLLVGRKRIVQVPDRVRRIGDLQDEVREGLHVVVTQRAAPAEQSAERDVELLECGILVERARVGLRAWYD